MSAPTVARRPYAFTASIQGTFLQPHSPQAQDVDEVFETRRDILDKIISSDIYARVCSLNRPTTIPIDPIEKRTLQGRVLLKTNAELMHLASTVFTTVLHSVQLACFDICGGAYVAEGLRALGPKCFGTPVLPGITPEICHDFYDIHPIETTKVPDLFKKIWHGSPERREIEGRVIEVYLLNPVPQSHIEHVFSNIQDVLSGNYLRTNARAYNIPPEDMGRVHVYHDLVKEVVKNIAHTIPEFTFYFDEMKEAYTSHKDSPKHKTPSEIEDDVCAFMAAAILFGNDSKEGEPPSCYALECLRLGALPHEDCHRETLASLHKCAQEHKAVIAGSVTEDLRKRSIVIDRVL